MADRDEAALHAAVSGLGVGRDRAVAVTADVAKPADVRRLVAIAVESLGRLDVLVNNAGVVRLAALTATPEEIWAREVGKSGIRVVAVVPGWIATDSNLPNDEDRAWLAANTSLGRAGRPEEVAGVVACLAGPDASFISGQAIIADGGEV